jgi:hypothetical protein
VAESKGELPVALRRLQQGNIEPADFAQALSGTTLRELVRRLVEQGLRQPSAPPGPGASRRQPPPVIIQPRGKPIAAVSRARARRLEEEDDEAKRALGFAERRSC